MRRIIVGLLFLTSLIGKVDELPTMTLLRPQASEILSDSEGTQFSITNTSLIIQIDENSFEIIGEII